MLNQLIDIATTTTVSSLQKQQDHNEFVSTINPKEFENKYVKDIYTEISHEFSKTRYSVWMCVKDFISSISEDETILEAGCGNGKNLIRKNMCGIDICPNFVDECKKLNLDVEQGDTLNINYSDSSFDNTMSIAVIHHMANRERRKYAIQELVRVTKPNGLIFILVMSIDVHLKRIKINEMTGENFDDDNEQDVFILFNGKPRYYHLFKENELISIANEISNETEIIKSFHEKGNYGIYLRKK